MIEMAEKSYTAHMQLQYLEDAYAEHVRNSTMERIADACELIAERLKD